MSSPGSVGDGPFCPNCNCLVTPVFTTSVNNLACPLCDGELLSGAPGEPRRQIPNPSRSRLHEARLQIPNRSRSRLQELRSLELIVRSLNDLELSNFQPNNAVHPTIGAIRDYVDSSVGLLNIAIEGMRLMEEHRPFGVLPAGRSAVASLPEIVIGEGLGAGNEALCTVCRDVLVTGANATQLACGHFFHRGCILRWLALRNTCPVCRRELPTEDPAPGGVGVRNRASGGSGSGGRADY